MLKTMRKRTYILWLFAALAISATSRPADAQSYPIDCAILLCLSGGWPASEPCARARAEFIRRITPWPVEPPLQIWRCPMGVTYDRGGKKEFESRVQDAAFERALTPIPHLHSDGLVQSAHRPSSRVDWPGATRPGQLAKGFALQLAQSRADIDISGPEFDFVRSIRVFDVSSARQYEAGSEGDCQRSSVVSLGTYGTQGDFSWQRSSPSALPAAHVGLEQWGENCPNIWHRSVFVEWRDFEGRYGFEQVNY